MTFARTIATGLAALFVLACSDTTSPPVEVAGVWNLRVVDGRGVDTRPADTSSVWIRMHDQLNLRTDGAYLEQIQSDAIDATSGALVASNHASLTGYWTTTDSTLTLTGDREQTGTISGDTLRIGTSLYTR